MMAGGPAALAAKASRSGSLSVVTGSSRRPSARMAPAGLLSRQTRSNWPGSPAVGSMGTPLGDCCCTDSERVKLIAQQAGRVAYRAGSVSWRDLACYRSGSADAARSRATAAATTRAWPRSSACAAAQRGPPAGRRTRRPGLRRRSRAPTAASPAQARPHADDHPYRGHKSVQGVQQSPAESCLLPAVAGTCAPRWRNSSFCPSMFFSASARVGASAPRPPPPARSQQRPPTRPTPAAGARRPSARPPRQPG